MIWLLLPLAAGVVIWWWPAGESVPALRPGTVVQSTPVAAQKGLPTLPSGPLKSDDWPQVEKTVRQAMAQCAPPRFLGVESLAHTLDRPTATPLMGQVDCLLGWLKAQACVKALRTPLAEAEGMAAIRLLTSLPAQVEIEVDFLVENQEVQTRVLILAVDAGEQLQFVSLRLGALSGP